VDLIVPTECNCLTGKTRVWSDYNIASGKRIYATSLCVVG